MARPKADAANILKSIRQECEHFLKEHGRDPKVLEISKIMHMSNNTTNDIVMEWKEERAAAAQVINLPDELFVQLEEGRQYQENLLRDMVAKKDRERELVRIPAESGHDSGRKAATVPFGIRPAFRFDSGHNSGEFGQYFLRV